MELYFIDGLTKEDYIPRRLGRGFMIKDELVENIEDVVAIENLFISEKEYEELPDKKV